MYMNTGYLNKSRPLIVGSCGTYRLSSHPKLPTYRPRGRLDYQLIYITAGCGHFHFGNVGNETIVPAGNIVLYRPKELQKYEYYGEDKTEVYWIHFTGSNVKNILRQYGFPDKERVFQVGTSMEYERVFKRIIIYEEMLVLLLRHLLITFHRELTREHILKNEYLDQEMNTAVTYFSENYNQDINIEDYAASRGMSVSWFIRNFKKYTGSTPMQFIVGIRINNAQMLLETTTYSINAVFQSAFSQAERIFTARIPKAEKQILKSTKRIPPNHQNNDL